MMNRIKELRYLTLVMFLCSFLAVGSLSSCREQPKEENTEQHMDAHEDHSEDGEHSGGEEHPEGEHPEGEEHPHDSISG